MSSSDTVLPSGYESLEPFVAHWARPNAAERAGSRTASSDTERRAFYAATNVRFAEALGYLDGKGFAQFDIQDERLMNLLLGFAHCAQAIEVQGDAESSHAKLRNRLTIVRASAEPI